MIAFGAAVTDRDLFGSIAMPGIERAAEPGSPVLVRVGMPIRDAYNEIMAEAASLAGLKALVLLHQDLELTDDSLPRRLRAHFADPCIALVGALGARGVEPHRWLASRDLYGTVAAPGLEHRFSSGPHEVECVDGALLALAPWVVRGLRFGATPGAGFHGYDLDISFRVRAHGARVVCDDIPYFHHREPKQDFSDHSRAGVALARIWDPRCRPRQWQPAFQL